MLSISSKTPSIYQIRHIASSKVYVGSAVNPHKRCNEHRNALRNGVHHSRYLQRAWDKYGEDAFAFEILEPVLFVEDLLTREQYWMDTLRAGTRAHGFNVSSVAGSVLGTKATDETRAKLRGASRARANPMSDPAIREKHRIATLVKSDSWRVKQKAGIRAYTQSDVGRKQKSEARLRWLADPANRARHAEMLKQRAKDPAWREKMDAVRNDPAYTQAHKEGIARAHQNPEYKAAQKAGMERLSADPAWRAWRAEKNQQYAKTYTGFVSPDGTVYAPVHHLSNFCKEHGLLAPHMGNVASGKARHHHGWTRYDPPT